MAQALLKAKFRGKCAACGRSYEPDEPIVGQGKGNPALHERCWSSSGPGPTPQQIKEWDQRWADARDAVAIMARENRIGRKRRDELIRAERERWKAAFAAEEWGSDMERSLAAKEELEKFAAKAMPVVTRMPEEKRAAMVGKAQRKSRYGVPFKADRPGWCANCHVEFGFGTRVVYNSARVIVHYGGCPSKR